VIQRGAHEPDAVATRRLRRIAALLATGLAAIMLLMWLLLQTWLHTTVPPIGAVPPEPRLQSNPTAQLAAQRAREQALLDGYAWVDRNAGIARIPVGRAMDILARASSSAPTRPGRPR
jgi:hypothetical protein